jgi:hypothetical protein
MFRLNEKFSSFLAPLRWALPPSTEYIVVLLIPLLRKFWFRVISGNYSVIEWSGETGSETTLNLLASV